ncbi:MAG TPA: rhomboid family intramembrane serine protease [Polyangiaceae bacterium]|nr:rhomboid family intramembrane serine protease [Polyangiaceae bacterium]
MSRLGGVNCPYCRYYNARDERACGRCQRRLPPADLSPLLARLGGVDLWATKALAGVSIVVFALQLVSSGRLGLGSFMGGDPIAVLRFGGLSNQVAWAEPWGEPWRLLAACFVHFNLMHIAMNLFALAELGRAGERLVGGSRFVFAYVVTGVVGFVVSTFWYGADPYLTAGASGAIFGLDGLLLGDRMARRDPVWKDMLVRTVIHSFLFYFVMRTNQAAHMGGLAAGLVLGALFARERHPWKRDGIFAGFAAFSAFAIAASLVLPHLGPAIRAEPRAPAPRGTWRQTDPRPQRRQPAPTPAPAEGEDQAGEGEGER